MSAGQGSARARQPRLGIVDVFDLDRQRRLVLLRRDNVEHLVMIGGPNDLVVESSIARTQAGRAAPAVEAMLERALQPDEVEREGRATAENRIAAAEPRFEPRADQRSVPKSPRGAPAAPPSAGGAGRADLASPPRTAPKPGDETVLNDMTRQLEEALKKPFATSQKEAEAPQLKRDAPPPSTTAPTKPTESTGTGGPAPPRQSPVMGSLSASIGARTAAPLKPSPAKIEAGAQEPVRPQAKQVDATKTDDKPEVTKPDPAKDPAKTEVRTEASKADALNPAAAKAEPAKAPPAKAEAPQAPPAKELDPFSPEAIEAEFARLLGRLPSKSDG